MITVVNLSYHIHEVSFLKVLYPRCLSIKWLKKSEIDDFNFGSFAT